MTERPSLPKTVASAATALKQAVGVLLAVWVLLWLSAPVSATPAPALAPAPVKLNGLVIFGDSLSDNGNTWRLSHYYQGLPDPYKQNYQTNMFSDLFRGLLPTLVGAFGPSVVSFPIFPTPPYDGGYFSNGPVTIDYLADYLGLDKAIPEQYTNLAFGASWTSSFADTLYHSWTQRRPPGLRLMFQGKVMPPNFSHVAEVYISHHPRLDPNTMYAIYFSGNDYINGFSDPLVVVSRQFNTIRQMIEAGARHIFWGLVPDYSMAPCFQQGARRDVVSGWGAQHNLHVQKAGETGSESLAGGSAEPGPDRRYFSPDCRRSR